MTPDSTTTALTVQPAEDQAVQPGGEPMVFSFGDAEGVLDRREIWSYFEMWQNGRWYEPPLPVEKVAKALGMTPHHGSAVRVKVNLLVKHLIPSRWITRDSFERFALDFVHMGNGYLERVDNLGSRVLRLDHSPAVHTRVGTEEGVHWFVKPSLGQEHQFKKGSIFHLQQPDVMQEVYGVPEWLSALQSMLLNENATLFRRRYYLNGAHAGSVLYINEPLATPEDVKNIAEKMKQAKGFGNFKNLLIYTPGGKKDGVQIMPIGDIATKDEFLNIKNVTMEDVLAAHRVPPQMISVIPKNNGGFGDYGRTSDVFFANEIEPIIQRMLALNDWAGVKVLEFKPYEKQGVAGAAAPAR